MPPPTPSPPGPPHLDRALDLVRFLRAHCPWDAEQTPRSLIRHLLEEAHEVADAIREDDPLRLRDELGDLLLNLAFQVVLAEETGAFDADAVARALEEKMRRRHPHLYGDGERRDWEHLKAEERTEPGGILDSLPSGLDPLQQAYRLQEKAAAVGFDWPDASGALDKLREEHGELEDAIAARDPARIREELGDLLFSVVNVARLLGEHPAEALDGTNRKFRRRFRGIEARMAARGLAWEGATLEMLDALWDEAKADE